MSQKARHSFVVNLIKSHKNDIIDFNVIEYWLRRLHGIEPEPNSNQSDADLFEAFDSSRKPVCTLDEFCLWQTYLSQKYSIKVGVAKFKGIVLKPRNRCWQCISKSYKLKCVGTHKC